MPSTKPSKPSRSSPTAIEQQHQLSAATARSAIAALPLADRAALELRFARIASTFSLVYFDDPDGGDLDAHVIRIKKGKPVRPPLRDLERQRIKVETSPKPIWESFYVVKLALHIGVFPFPQVDHKHDGHANFRLSNLRVTDASGNSRNRRPLPRRPENQHLARGVYRRVFPNGRVRYQVKLRDENGRRRSYGYFDTPEEANVVARALRLKRDGAYHRATSPNHRQAPHPEKRTGTDRGLPAKGQLKGPGKLQGALPAEGA